MRTPAVRCADRAEVGGLVRAGVTGRTREEAREWMVRMEREHGRYVPDVFA